MAGSDKQFFLIFSSMLAVLAIIAIIAVAVALHAGSKVEREKSTVQLEKTKQRIEPVGRVRLASAVGQEQPEETEATSAEPVVSKEIEEQQISASTTQAGVVEEIYASKCQVCHASGLAGAPKLGDKAVWDERLKAGIDAVYQSAIKGKGAMPAKGGHVTLSDEDIKATVDYMLSASQ